VYGGWLLVFCFERWCKKNTNNTKPLITATPLIVPPTIAPIGVDEGEEEGDIGIGDVVVEAAGASDVVEVVEVVVEIIRVGEE